MRKSFLFLTFLLLNSILLFSQVAINNDGSAPDPSAMLDVKSTEHGILIPRISTLDRNLIQSPATGLIIYNTNTNNFNFYNGSFWYEIESSFISTTTGNISSEGGVSINALNNSPASNSAMLDINDTTRGLLITRTTPELISSPAKGLLIYNTTTNLFNYYDGEKWLEIDAVSTGIKGAEGSQPSIGVSYNTDHSNPHPSAILDVYAFDKGVLMPRLNNEQRDVLLPATGLMIFNTSENRIEYFNGSEWVQFGTSRDFPINKLPQKLLKKPAVFSEDFESLSKWTLNGGSTKSLNTSESKTGLSSIKIKTDSGVAGGIYKTEVWDLSNLNYNSLELSAYFHSNIDTTIDYIQVNIYFGTGFSNFRRKRWYATNYGGTFFPGQWNLLKGGDWNNGSGTANWADVRLIEIVVAPKAGQVAEVSFDLLEVGKEYKPAIMISFDDAHSSVYTKAFQYMKSKNMVGTFNIVSDWVGNPGSVTLSQLQEMYSKGWNITNHTKDHTKLSKLTYEQQLYEVDQCALYLIKNGMPKYAKHVAYPMYEYDANTILALNALNFKTGRQGPHYFYSEYDNYTDGYVYGGKGYSFPFELECSYLKYNETLEQSVQRIQKALIVPGAVVHLLFHYIVDAPAANFNEINFSVFRGIIDYLKDNNIQTITIDEFYNLNKEPITIYHN